MEPERGDREAAMRGDRRTFGLWEARGFRTAGFAAGFAAGAAALLGLATSAFAHGGSYRIPPGQAPPSRSGNPVTPTPPDGGGGTVTPPDGSTGTPTPPGVPTGTPTRKWKDSKDDRRLDTRSPWELWWAIHRDRYLNLRGRLRGRDDPGSLPTSGGGLGRTAGGSNGANVPRATKDPRTIYREEILPDLIRLLRDPDSEVRSAVTVALGRMGFVRAFPVLSKAREDGERDVRDGAVVGMGMLEEGIAVPDLRTVLFDPKEDDRSRGLAAVALGLVGGKDSAAELLTFLEDDDGSGAAYAGGRAGPDTVVCAVIGLGLAGDRSVLPNLRRALVAGRNLDVKVRSFLPIALARLGDRESVPLLLQSLGFRENPLRQSSAIALGLLGDPGDEVVRGALLRAARDDSDLYVRTYARMALAEIGGDGSRAALRRLFDEGKAADRPVTVLALGVAGDRDSGKVIQGLFTGEKNPDLRAAAAVALGLLHRTEAAEALREEAEGKKEADFRSHCLVALGMMEDGEAAEAAHRILVRDNDPDVRLSAALCLGLLRDRRALSVIDDLARGARNVFTRGNACRLLGLIGDVESARVLLAYAGDRDQHTIVRTYAVAALGVLAERSEIPLLTRVGMDNNYALPVDPLEEIASLL